MQKKNILLIIHCLPYPLNSGGRQAIYNGIKAIKDDYSVFISYPGSNSISELRDQNAFLSEMGGDVHLLPFVFDDETTKPTLLQKIARKTVFLPDCGQIRIIIMMVYQRKKSEGIPPARLDNRK